MTTLAFIAIALCLVASYLLIRMILSYALEALAWAQLFYLLRRDAKEQRNS